MLKKLLSPLVFLIFSQQLLAQTSLPVIKATSKSAKIKDGDKITGWSLSPEAKLDVFVANRTRKTVRITFYKPLERIKSEEILFKLCINTLTCAKFSVKSV